MVFAKRRGQILQNDYVRLIKFHKFINFNNKDGFMPELQSYDGGPQERNRIAAWKGR